MFYLDCMENPFFYRHYAPLIAPNWCAPFLMFPRIQEGEPGAKSYPGHSSASTPNVQNIKHVKWKKLIRICHHSFQTTCGSFLIKSLLQTTGHWHEPLWMIVDGGGRGWKAAAACFTFHICQKLLSTSNNQCWSNNRILQDQLDLSSENKLNTHQETRPIRSCW